MAVKYDKLFDILKERKMKAVELQKAAGFSGNIMTRIRRNEYVSLESIRLMRKWVRRLFSAFSKAVISWLKDYRLI